MNPRFIRNFSIIAHIDHGKSTLADRLLQHTKSIDERKFQDQVLDSMDVERERGITIKSHPVIMYYQDNYILNLIDTPGHVDFSYEVSRSLAACEGALLLIDATQGVQAQTVANVNLAMQENLVIIPIINKIDLPAANIELCLEQLEELLALPSDEVILASAKQGLGVDRILQSIIQRIPPPEVFQDNSVVKALIFDSVFDPFRGVVNYVRIVQGRLRKGDSIHFWQTDLNTDIKEVGVFSPSLQSMDVLETGQVGYVIANIKHPDDAKIGDTITSKRNPCRRPLPGFKQVQPMVFSGIYPLDSADYVMLDDSMAKLRLNDAAFSYQTESSAALGFGFRCGFLGLLHLEIIQERLRREYKMDIIATYPSVVYRVYLKDGTRVDVENPLHLPESNRINHIEEPIVKANIMISRQYLGSLLNLIMEKRGICLSTQNSDRNNMILLAELPFNEIVIDFHDKLKTLTRGYGSMDCELTSYRQAELIKMEIHVNGDPVDAFATIVHKDMANKRGKNIVNRLKDVIPQHLFQIAIQAVVGNKVLARENVRALRKDVIAKCYGGDITRKRKLLEKQKVGKKKMKQIGKINIPQDAFIKVLQSN